MPVVRYVCVTDHARVSTVEEDAWEDVRNALGCANYSDLDDLKARASDGRIKIPAAEMPSLRFLKITIEEME